MPFTRTQIAERVAAAKEEYDDDDGWTKTDWDKWAKKELRAEQEAATAGEKEWVVQEEAAPKGGARGESTWASIIQEDAASTMGKAEARSYVLEMPLKKHAGKTLGVVLEIDRPYLDWAISIVRPRRARTARRTGRLLTPPPAARNAGASPEQAVVDEGAGHPGHNLRAVHEDAGREDPRCARPPPADANGALP